jgi:CopG family transcriptional regulator, nickel-responsive regulator
VGRTTFWRHAGSSIVPDIIRFSVSLEDELLKQFDQFCATRKFATRSEAIRQLLREKLTTTAWEASAEEVAASLTLIYDHHRANLTNRMIAIQHDYGDHVVSTLHVHISHDLCMELIALRGPAKALQNLAAELSGLKGIQQAQLVVIKAGPGADSYKRSRHHAHIH